MDNAPQQQSLALTVPEAARELRVSPRTVERMIRRGTLPSFKVGRSRRLSRRALAEFLTDTERTADATTSA